MSFDRNPSSPSGEPGNEEVGIVWQNVKALSGYIASKNGISFREAYCKENICGSSSCSGSGVGRSRAWIGPFPNRKIFENKKEEKQRENV